MNVFHIWILFAILLLGLNTPSRAQITTPYQLEWSSGLAIAGSGILTFAIGERASARMDLLRLQDIEQLSTSDVFALDRFATRQNSTAADKISDYSGYGSVILPMVLFARDGPRQHYDQVSSMYAQVFMLNYGITHLVKNTVRRPRPYTFNRDVPLSLKRIKNARRSFFSGHTSFAAANKYFTAKVFSDFDPSSNAKHWVWTGAIVLPAITGTTRVLAGKHYWTDVIVGYAVGAGIGLLIPQLNLL